MDENRIEELALRAQKTGTAVFTNFLNEQTQAEIATKYCAYDPTFFGGTSFAERKIACFGGGEDFPLRVLQITPTGGKYATELSHRDVLGAIMALQITREKVGDIFVGKQCYVVLHQSVADFVAQNLLSVGRNNVKTQFVEEIPSNLAPQMQQAKISVSSNRLDAVLCKVFNLSRQQASQLIDLQKVSLNGLPCQKSTRPLNDGDVVSVRGYGKFAFGQPLGQSKKGKLQFSVFLFA